MGETCETSDFVQSVWHKQTQVMTITNPCNLSVACCLMICTALS